MDKVDVLPAARREFREAFHWYRDRGPLVGRRFALQVKATIAAIQDDPNRFARWNEKYRYCIVHGFPYFVAYRQTENAVIIVAIRHASQDQDAWQGR